MPRSRLALPLVLLLLLLLGGGGAVALFLGPGSDPGQQLDGDPHDRLAAANPFEGPNGLGVRDAAPQRTTRERVAPRRPPATDPAVDVEAAGDERAGTAGASEHEVDGGEADEGTGAAGSNDGAVPEESERPSVRGRVVDSATGEALTDVRVLVARPGHGWYGTRSDDDGGFEGLAPSDPGDGSRIEVRIGKPGYHTLVVPWEEGELDVQLVPRDHLPQPGAVDGLATDPNGHAITGRILLTTYDEMGDHHGLWAWADHAGEFRLDGLMPGWWSMRLVGGDTAAEVVVPDGGSAPVHLIGGSEPWPGTMTEEQFAARREELSRGRPPGATDEALSDDQRQALAWQRALAVQDLESRWRAVRPARPLVVTGLPTEGVAHLRAASTHGPNHSWRVPVIDGVARFRALTTERWQLILEVPGEAVVARDIRIAERDPDDPDETDAVDYAWPAPEAPDDR